MPRLSYALCALALGHAAIAAPQLSPRATGSLDTWLATETTVSLNGILANIGADGAYAKSAKPGVIVASPSTSNPDCENLLNWPCRTIIDISRLLYLDERCCSCHESPGRSLPQWQPGSAESYY